MKRKRITNAFVVVLVIIEIISIFLVYKSGSNRETILDNVKLNEIDKYNNFALMIEQDGEYIESKTFPASGYVLNETLSGCIDNNGNTLENALTYINGTINLRTRTNAMCYLYFDEEEIYATQYLIENVDSNVLWDSTLEDDGYRYVGTNPDNYVCFGTTSQEECISDTDKYMYRIIGIFESEDGTQHLKLIKKEALNTNYAWNVDYENDVDWDGSDLYIGINGSYFLNNPTYSYMQDSNWMDEIVEWNYTATNTKTYENYNSANGTPYGPNYYNTTPVSSIYLHELNRNGKSSTTCYYNASTTADCSVGKWKYPTDSNWDKSVVSKVKISLMYASDYLLSLGSSALNYTNSTSAHYQAMKTGWMHLSNNDSGAPSRYEWTSTRYGVFNDGNYYAWDVNSYGRVSYPSVDGVASVRPVFYLTENIKITLGKGSITEPFIIN